VDLVETNQAGGLGSERLALLAGGALLISINRSTLNSDPARFYAVLVLACLVHSTVGAWIASRLQHDRIVMADRLALLSCSPEVLISPASGEQIVRRVPAQEATI
jgi:hypothetical protein